MSLRVSLRPNNELKNVLFVRSTGKYEVSGDVVANIFFNTFFSFKEVLRNGKGIGL